MIRIGSQTEIQVLQSILKSAARDVDLGDRKIACRAPRIVPGGFIKRCIGLILAPEVAKSQAETIERLAVIWVRIAEREPFDRSTQELLGETELAATQVPQTQPVIATSIARIAPECFLPVRLGIACGVT